MKYPNTLVAIVFLVALVGSIGALRMISTKEKLGSKYFHRILGAIPALILSAASFHYLVEAFVQMRTRDLVFTPIFACLFIFGVWKMNILFASDEDLKKHFDELLNSFSKNK